MNPLSSAVDGLARLRTTPREMGCRNPPAGSGVPSRMRTLLANLHPQEARGELALELTDDKGIEQMLLCPLTKVVDLTFQQICFCTTSADP
jgi:hypothetical protein